LDPRVFHTIDFRTLEAFGVYCRCRWKNSERAMAYSTWKRWSAATFPTTFLGVLMVGVLWLLA
jgi:hypothetical protein